MMKLRFASPDHLIDINRIDGLDDDRGAATASCGSARSSGTTSSPRPTLISARYPTIAAAAPQIADPLVRNLGHDRRLARPRRPRRRPRLGDAGARRERRAEERERRARGADRRVPGRHVHHLDRSRTRSSPRSACRARAHAPAAPTSSSSARSATTRPWPSRSRLALSNGSIGTRGHRAHRRSGSRTSRRPPPRPPLVGAGARATSAFAEAGRLAAAASSPVDRRPRDRGVQAPHGRGVRAARPRQRARDGRRGLTRGGDRTMEITVNVNGTERAADVETALAARSPDPRGASSSPAPTSAATRPAAARARSCWTACR